MNRLLDLRRGFRHDGRLGVLIMMLLEERRPVIWGMINECYQWLDSREEAETMLRAATYALGIPLAEERRVRQLISNCPLAPLRTKHEHDWKLALYVGQRNEECDVALRNQEARVASETRQGRVSRAPGKPICLDPHPAFSAYN
jgi:hypothetical protein